MRLPVFAIVLVMSPLSLVAETPKTADLMISDSKKEVLADICASPKKILLHDCVKRPVTGNARRGVTEYPRDQNVRQSDNVTSSRLEGNHPSTRSDRVERYEQQFTQRGDGVKVPVRPIKPITAPNPIKPISPPKPGTGEIVKPWKPVDPGLGETSRPAKPTKPLPSPHKG